jgi:glycosyltransferase involved in cell wall biosynthesis
MKSFPLVTIGLTCFNCEKTVERALKSAINQDWINKEIILIDDCSTDNSKVILSKLKSQYPQIQLIINGENHGLAYNENLIIKKAKGEFVVFFDGDDESQIDRISKQYEKFLKYKNMHPDSEIFVYSNRNVIPINDNEKNFTRFAIGRKSPEPHGKIVADYLLKIKKKSDKFCWGVLGSGTVFAKISYIRNLNGFDVSFKRGAELDLWIRAAIEGCHFISVNESLMTQYITFGTHKTLKKDLLSRKQLLKKHKKYLNQNLLYTSSLLNFYAWYWYQKKIYLVSYVCKFFSFAFSLINKARNLTL